MRGRLVILLVAYALGEAVSDASGGSWLVWLSGALVQLISICLVVHMIYLDGFRAGADSVPLDGAGLASGDDRAYGASHRWNADLGAWEKRK
jgi:hypothetical protein